jgi:hypothetical protein
VKPFSAIEAGVVGGEKVEDSKREDEVREEGRRLNRRKGELRLAKESLNQGRERLTYEEVKEDEGQDGRGSWDRLMRRKEGKGKKLLSATSKVVESEGSRNSDRETIRSGWGRTRERGGTRMKLRIGMVKEKPFLVAKVVRNADTALRFSRFSLLDHFWFSMGLNSKRIVKSFVHRFSQVEN